MGFFSFNCEGCGQSLRSYHAVNAASSWMQSAVVYTADGKFHQGAYDGYGRLETASENVELLDGACTVYHQRCWRLLGRPKGFLPVASGAAADQGYFTDFHPEKPKTRGEMQQLRKHRQVEKRLVEPDEGEARAEENKAQLEDRISKLDKVLGLLDGSDPLYPTLAERRDGYALQLRTVTRYLERMR